MKILVIGGSKGIGQEIVDYYSPNSMSVSRTTGYDIRNPQSRQEIAKLSMSYDVVVNHAYCGDNSQTNMLHDLYNYWKENEKNGYIFNTGSVATYLMKYNEVNVYPAYKISQDVLCAQIAKQTQCRNVKFRITNVRPGMLDTEKSRQKPNWPGNGLTGKRYIDIIEWLYNSPEDLVIADIVLETKVPKK